jgi:molybdopterin-guanine dinucleotide biosynthesis protein B
VANTTRLISVIGKKDSGKTTLVVALSAEFVRRRKRVATIKHGHHPARVDQEGKDTWRHYNEGKAERVMIASPGSRVLFHRTDAEADPIALAREYMQGMDLVIVEGFTKRQIPKIEVFRRGIHATPLYDPSNENAEDWVAMVTDDPPFDLPFPYFRFSDTSWLMALASIAWEHAIPIDG